MFQSTHPRRVRRFLWPLAAGYTLRFNPRTHAGCDGMVVTVTTIRRMFQSTHPRRVRRMASPVIWLPPVSIHAPTQGATSSSGSNTAPPALFQSTHPRRVRPSTARPWPRWCHVSIHAPTQGATPWLSKAERSAAFQSTHPRRVRRCAVGAALRVRCCFNPRTHAGCDAVDAWAKAAARAFQSTHPRRVRLPLRNPFILQQKARRLRTPSRPVQNATLPSPPII